MNAFIARLVFPQLHGIGQRDRVDARSPARTIALRRASWAVVALALVLPVLGQERDLVELLSGNTIPLSQRLRDLTPDWRRITIGSGGTASGNISVNVSGNQSGPTSQNNLVGALGNSRSYVTKGETVTANRRVYLIAYHLPTAGLDLGQMLQALATKTLPSTVVLTPDSTISLSLLDLGHVGSLEDVRPFDPKAEIAEYERTLRTLGDLFKSQSGGASTNSSKK